MARKPLSIIDCTNKTKFKKKMVDTTAYSIGARGAGAGGLQLPLVPDFVRNIIKNGITICPLKFSDIPTALVYNGHPA